MKSSKAPLERKRPLFFTAGLLLAVSITLVSFEWRTPYQGPKDFEKPKEITDEVVWIPVTLSEPEVKKEKPAPPKLEKPSIEFDIVDDLEKEPNENLEILTMDDFDDLTGIGKTPEPDVEDEDLKIWKFPMVMASYCGGEKAMFDFLGSVLTYPEIPRMNGVSGVVYVQFVVGKSGMLRDAKVLRPVDPWLDAEALRVAKMLDCFTPGKQAGRNVDVYFVLPVRFKLE